MQHLIMPINKSKVTAGFLNKKYSSRFKFLHYGIDLVSRTSDMLVYGSGKGKVLLSGFDKVLGNTVIILYNDVYNHVHDTVVCVVGRYYHLRNRYVKVGDDITDATHIGFYGRTGGFSTGNHLHLAFDTDIKYYNYSPQLVNGSIIKGTGSGAYRYGHKDFSTINPMEILHTVENQDYTIDINYVNRMDINKIKRYEYKKNPKV